MQIKLKKILKEQSLTVTAFSKNTGISRSTISQLVNSDKLPEQTKISTLLKIAKSLNVDLFELLVKDENSYSFTIISEKTNYYGENIGILNIDTEFKKYMIPISFNLVGELERKQDKELKEKIDKIYLNALEKIKKRYPNDISNDSDAEMKSGYFFYLIDKEEDIKKELDNAVAKENYRFETTYPLELKSIKLNLLDKECLNNLLPVDSTVYSELVPFLSKYAENSNFLATLTDDDLKEISIAFFKSKIIEKETNIRELTFSFCWDFLKKDFGIHNIKIKFNDDGEAISKV